MVVGGGLKLRVFEEEDEDEEAVERAAAAAAAAGGMIGATVKTGVVVLLVAVARVRWAGMGWMGESGTVGLRMDFTAGVGASCTRGVVVSTYRQRNKGTAGVGGVSGWGGWVTTNRRSSPPIAIATAVLQSPSAAAAASAQQRVQSPRTQTL